MMRDESWVFRQKEHNEDKMKKEFFFFFFMFHQLL